MGSRSKPGLRRFLTWIHTWAGLPAGLFVAVVSLTGSVIVFRTELELAPFPQGKNVAPLVGLNEIARQVSQSQPGARIRRVRLPMHDGEPFVVQIEAAGKQTSLACEASTGRVLGTLNTGFVSWMIDLHRNLLSGKTGRKAVGVVGIVLFVLSLSGMLIWFAGARKWRSWISVRPTGSSRRFHFELHRATGLWAFALLSVVSFTGIGLAFPDTFRGALQQITGSPASAKAPRVSKATGKMLHSLEEYLRAGAGAMPDGTPVELRLPENDKGPVDLRLRRAGDIAPDGNHVYLEPSTGKVLSVARLVDQPLATRIFAALSPIHYAEFGGVTAKILWSLLGLAPSILFITGFMTWWRPRQRRKPSTPQEEPAVAAGSVVAARSGQR